MKWLEGKIFTAPDASGATGRQFFFVMIQSNDPSERIVGAAGVNRLDPSPSVGYAVHPEFWNQGYATEAVGAIVDAWWKLPRASLDLGQQNKQGGLGDDGDVEKLFAACNMANVGSLQVLLKNGFEISTKIPLEGDIVALMEQKNPNALSQMGL
jgi:RimJ/RimL family protein N-acetyltransferase